MPRGVLQTLEDFAVEAYGAGWLTGSADLHLLPKLQAWLEAHADWRPVGTQTAGPWWVIDVEWLSSGRARDRRAAAVALVGSFAESATFIRQGTPDGFSFDIATGQPDDPDGYAAHGHLVRLRMADG